MSDGLRLNQVTAGYGETVVLNGVSLTLPMSGTLALLGRNGVGKSTLLATIMGHTTMHGGRIQLAGRDITAMPIHHRVYAGIGYVPQEREVFGSLTVAENLLVAARPGKWTADAVYELFPNLAERRGNLGGQLSGGEQQMLAVGRALMANPSVLLMDEPLEGLAPVIVEMLMRAIAKLRAADGLAILLVEQHARLALDFAAEAVVLDRGRVVYGGPSRTLRDDPTRLDSLIGVARADRAATA